MSLTLSTLVSGEITFGGLDHKSYWLKGKYAFIIFTKTNNLKSIQDHYLLWVVERAFFFFEISGEIVRYEALAPRPEVLSSLCFVCACAGSISL